MDVHTNSKELFRAFTDRITIAESRGEIDSIVYLVMHSIFGLRREHIMAGKEVVYDPAELDQIILRINNNEPVQYILQEAEFYGRLFFVDRHVLIPRPETELLVKEVIEFASPIKSNVRILDIGTGSGCIAVTLACELPDSTVHASDISNDAIEIAHKNSLTFNSFIDFHQNDVLNEDLPVTDFDIIVSNPPYVAAAESAAMSANVLQHEPHIALFVPDNDPLVFYRAIVRHATLHLKRGGALFVEINERYGADVRQLFVNAGFSEVSVVRDMDGKERVVGGRWP